MPLPDNERAVFKDMYHFYEQFADRPLNADTFSAAADEMAFLVQKHGNTLLAKDMFLAIYNHLGNKYEEGRDKQ
jgi:hypothetical protein